MGSFVPPLLVRLILLRGVHRAHWAEVRLLCLPGTGWSCSVVTYDHLIRLSLGRKGASPFSDRPGGRPRAPAPGPAQGRSAPHVRRVLAKSMRSRTSKATASIGRPHSGYCTRYALYTWPCLSLKCPSVGIYIWCVGMDIVQELLSTRDGVSFPPCYVKHPLMMSLFAKHTHNRDSTNRSEGNHNRLWTNVICSCSAVLLGSYATPNIRFA